MLVLLLAACTPVAGTNAGDTRVWTSNWADHLVYQSVAVDTLGAGGSDTAADPTARLDATLVATGAEWALSLRAADDAGLGDIVRELTFSTDKGLAVTQVDGAVLDPAVVLLPATWDEGAAVVSGDYTATTDPLAAAVTWYGTFADVVTVRVSGPAGDPLAGLLRFAPDVGLVQFALGDTAGDLVWYDPAATAAADE
jgi:hypothetical protein